MGVTDDHNTGAQDEELAVLQAIYGDDCEVDIDQRTVQVYIPSRQHPRPIALHVVLTDSYPSHEPPAALVTGEHLPDSAAQQACRDLEGMFTPGAVVLYDWVEWLKQAAHLHAAAGGGPCASLIGGDDIAGPQHPQHGTPCAQARGAQGGGSEDGDWEPGPSDEDGDSDDDNDDGERDDESCAGGSVGEALERGGEGVTGRDDLQKRATASHSVTAAIMDLVRGRIISGDPFTERKSTFQAHLAHVRSPSEALAVVEVLLESNKIRNATHNIMAYRIEVEGRPGTLHADCDDDGEAAAGGRLLHLLNVADARNVVVVVSRWFGGVLLGPARFTLINNAARQLLEAQGVISGGGGAGSPAGARKGNNVRKGVRGKR